MIKMFHLLNHDLTDFESLCLLACSIYSLWALSVGIHPLTLKISKSACVLSYAIQHAFCLFSKCPESNALYTWVLYEYTTLLEPTLKTVESFLRFCLETKMSVNCCSTCFMLSLIRPVCGKQQKGPVCYWILLKFQLTLNTWSSACQNLL